MSDMSGKAADPATRLGLAAGDVVGELGYDDDSDANLRAGIESIIGSEILGGDADEVFDAVLVWWRDGDGDLADELVDAISSLADDGVVILATPRAGHDGFVSAGDIDEAADTAGLGKATSGAPAGQWTAVRLTRGKAPGKSRR